MIFDILKKALIDQLGIDAELIQAGSCVKKDFQLDSTETVILALEIKKHYGVDFKFSSNDMSLAEICDLVSKMHEEKVPAC